MSASDALQSVWNPADSDDSKTPTSDSFVSYLAEQNLLKGRPLNRDGDEPLARSLSSRNKDRIRILKRLSAAPSGLPLKTIVSEVVKGQRVGQCERFDGSDADYNFAYNYCNELSEFVPPDFDVPLLRKRNGKGGLEFRPRTSLIDLISEGIAQTHHALDADLYDRAFARDILKHSVSLTSDQKGHLASSLESYVDRIDDYRLLFDITTYDDRGHGANEKRMTKRYKTRFNDQGRIAKGYSQFNDYLEYQLENSHNAVLCTLTSDPGTEDDSSRPDPRSLLERTDTINENHNRLMAYLKSDPEKARDTRKEGVPQWTPERDPSNYYYFPDGVPKGGAPDGPVTGRPGQKLEYIKVLEFQDSGNPHLHILFFDVPTREKDGMPWLIDKHELEKRWEHYGQGQIVDTYPLAKRDLDDLDADFAGDNQTGFVDWYRHGDHDRNDAWIQNQIDDHDIIDFNEDDEEPKESTAGAYLGKYLSALMGSLMDNSESLNNPDDQTHEDKTATWKLAMYWATNKRFWSVSQETREACSPNEHLRESSDVAETCRWASVETVSRLAHGEIMNHLARRSWSDSDDLADAAQEAAESVVTPSVESTLPEPADFGVLIDYIGAYAKWDLPTSSLSAPPLDDTTDQFEQANSLPPDPRADRPPPIETVWN